MRYTTYGEYLASDHWSNLREHKIAVAGRVCAVCQRDDGKIVCHHINYKPDIHDCTIDDVIMLCDACHRDLHAACNRRGLKPHDFQSRGQILWAIEKYRKAAQTKILPTALPKPRKPRGRTVAPGTLITPFLLKFLLNNKPRLHPHVAQLLGVKFPPEKDWRKKLEVAAGSGKLRAQAVSDMEAQ